MDSMLKNSSVKITDEMLESHEVLCESSNDWDGDLAQLVAMVTHTEVAKLKTGEIRFRGTRVSVEEAEKHYTHQRDSMYRLGAFAILGHMMGSFGKEALDEWIGQDNDVSETVKAGIKEAEDKSQMQDIFSQEPSEAEGDLVIAAALAGAKDPVKLWEGLKS